MAEYIEREAAVKLLRDTAAEGYPTPFHLGLYAAARAIEALHAADVRPVVLCRDCKHWEAGWTPRGVSEGRHYCAPLDLFPSADWYCSDGERREES